MDAKEAAKAAIKINPKIAIPMHYGTLVGTKEDAEQFKKLVEEKSDVKVKILEKGEDFDIVF